MKTNVALRAAAIIIVLSLFPTCGELETLLPSSGSYQVRTLVNGSSLESCSIIRSDDKIRPYFAVSVVNDPDLIGLLVYFENSQGEVAGEKVRYILRSYAEESAATTTETEKEVKQDKANNKTSEETNITDEIIPEETIQKTQGTEENEPRGQKAWDLPEQGAVKEKWSFTDTKPAVKDIGIEIAVKSLSEELPYLPLPKTLEIGPYTLVFEAIGIRETLSRTETNVFYLGSTEFYLKDISIYLPGQSGSQLILPGTTVMLESRLDFDSRLDPYVVWYNGKNIISEGKISNGTGTILWKAPEQAGFYSLRLEAFPFHFKQNNYTGIFREITLAVSPKAATLGYFFENNREHTARSPLAAGTAYPEQVRLITAKKSAEDTNSAKEKNAPVLPPAGPPTPPPPPPPPPELLQWYQFEGSLHNSISPLTDTQLLSPVSAKAPRWAAAGQSYGLSIGSNDAYTLSPINFFLKENDQGGGIFLFHIIPAAEGTIFSAFFPLLSSLTDGVLMDMVREGNRITLRISAGGTTAVMPVHLALSEPQGLIPIVVEFYIRPYRMEAKLSAKYSPENKVGSIRLQDALSGEGIIRLGGGTDKSITDKFTTETSPAIPSNLTEPSLKETLAAITDSAEKDAGITAESKTPAAAVNQNTIWDEFAILYSAIPLLQEEPLTTDAADTEKNNETAADNKSDYKSAANQESAATGGSAPLKEKKSISDSNETENSPAIFN